MENKKTKQKTNSPCQKNENVDMEALFQRHLAVGREWKRGEKLFHETFQHGLEEKQKSRNRLWIKIAALVAIVVIPLTMRHTIQSHCAPYNSYYCNVHYSQQAALELLQSSIATL